MAMLHLVCQHCGAYGQMELGYAYGWEASCMVCGGIQRIPNELIPTGLQPRDYSSISTASPTEAHSPFHISGGINPRQTLISGHSPLEE